VLLQTRGAGRGVGRQQLRLDISERGAGWKTLFQLTIVLAGLVAMSALATSSDR
jgi:hypothetical protein